MSLGTQATSPSQTIALPRVEGGSKEGDAVSPRIEGLFAKIIHCEMQAGITYREVCRKDGQMSHKSVVMPAPVSCTVSLAVDASYCQKSLRSGLV